MKTQLIILPQGNILVSDEKIKLGDYYYRKGFKETFRGSGFENTDLKVIAGEPNLPSIDYNGLERQFGIVDIERLVFKHLESNHIQASPRRVSVCSELFKKAQELNDKRFSLEDMQKAMFAVYKNGIKSPKEGKESFSEISNRVINSLQQPKVFNVEIEVFCDEDNQIITNNKIKICKIL